MVDDAATSSDQPSRLSLSSLESIGLSAGEVAAYELLVERQRATARQLSAAWRHPESLAEILSALEAKGLVIKDAERADLYTAVSPRTALDALLWTRGRELEEAAAYVADLVTRHGDRGTGSGTPSLVEVVTGHRAVRQRLTQLERGSRREMCSLHSLAGGDGAGVSLDVRGLVEREISVRTVYDRRSIELPEGFPRIERAIDAGERARVGAVPTTLLVVDGRLAFLPLQRQQAAVEAAMVVHPSGLLDALVALFDELWRRAVPLPTVSNDAGREPATRPRSTGEERLIALLLSGLTDQAIGRQLGVGHRTVQRRVAALAGDLGAHSRFQAGVQVALRRLRDEA